MSTASKHHTSKLQKFEDLDEVATFGFRGEALSSLCATSKLQVITRCSNARLGTKLVFDTEGKIVLSKQIASQIGTTVSVEDIFDKFPVRRKELLKNVKKEFVKVISILQAYALCAPENVRINAVNTKNGGKRETILNISEKGDLRDKIVNIFGPEQEKNMVEVSYFSVDKNSGFGIEGFISSCCHGKGRSRGDRQFFFVQNRPCDLSSGVKAINEMYHQYNRHQYPFFVFKITSSTKGNIDVNLTPDKRRILLQKETFLWQALKEKLKLIFDKIAPPAATSNFLPPKEPKCSRRISSSTQASNREKVSAMKSSPLNEEKETPTVLSNLKDMENETKKKLIYLYDEPSNDRKRMRVIHFSMSRLKRSVIMTRNDKKTEDDIKGRKFVARLTSERAENELRKHLDQKDFLSGHFEIIGQFNLGFIVVRLLQDDLFIVDQHASDEKFRFESLTKSVKRVTQPLVLPQELRLDPGKREILKSNLTVLESQGFVFDREHRLSKVPQFGKLSLGPEDIDEILYILSEETELSANYQFPRVRAMLASKACRSAVMIGTSLNPSQMNSIIGHMSEMEHPWNCPHGRPTMRHLVNLQLLMQEQDYSLSPSILKLN